MSRSIEEKQFHNSLIEPYENYIFVFTTIVVSYTYNSTNLLHMSKAKGFIFSVTASLISLATLAQGTPKVVISQVYGGAGCGTAGCSTYKNDYIELFNAGTAAQSLNGWSVQYAAATGTGWAVTALTNVTLQPGQYYLIAESAGANGVNTLPTPDVTNTTAMSATAAKIALVSSTTALSGSCPSGAPIVDFVGYGTTANCNEGGANAPAPNTTTAAIRNANGCTDDSTNSTDFTAAAPNPRNTATAVAPCASLPVTFTSFTAQYLSASNTVTLRWSTAKEQDASEFVIERSVDGVTWTAITHVPATGNSTIVVNYEARDAQPATGSNLYRIKQVDLNGSYIYTRLIGITVASKAALFSVYPTIGEGTVYLASHAEAPVKASISISDINGRVLLNEQRTVNQSQSTTLELQRFGRGTYFITLSSGEVRTTQKVIVR